MIKVLDRVPNSTVYTFLVGILGEDSVKKANDVWCSTDRPKTWYAWMAKNVSIPEASEKCATPLERNAQLLTRYRIHGTPAVFFQDGERIPGFATAEQIEEKLKRSESKLR